jgi:hypothetical protein
VTALEKNFSSRYKRFLVLMSLKEMPEFDTYCTKRNDLLCILDSHFLRYAFEVEDKGWENLAVMFLP